MITADAMKVLLVYPYFLDDRLNMEDVSTVPMGVYYLGAMLKEHNYDVTIANWFQAGTSPETIRAVLKEKRPDVIGFSIVHANRWGGIEIARLAKRLNPQAITVMGGIGATQLWHHLLTHFPEIDYIVLGEGEYAFLELLRHVAQQPDSEPNTIKGIAYRHNNHPHRTPERLLIENLDALPDPSRYFQYSHVALTRGCPSKCSFCGSPRFWRGRVRSHSTDYFVNQVARLHSHGIRFIQVADDTFTLRPSKVIEICKKIIQEKLDITWTAISRVNTVNESLLYWMRKAGCIQISYGVESGSEKIRKGLNKRITTDQIKAAFAMTTAHGILARAYFIYGCPQETWDTITETIHLMDAIQPLNTIFYIMDLFPGTQLYEDYKKRTGLTDDMWLERVEDIMYFETDSAMDKELILAWGKKLRTTFYQHLPTYAGNITLVDNPELYPQHADFLSRLAMTFDQGDYANIEEIPQKRRTAEMLYHRALEYHPDPKAFLGLGIQSQKKRDYATSLTFLERGLARFPQHRELNICTAVSYLNVGRPDRALTHLEPFDDQEGVPPLIAACRKALGSSP